MSSLVFWFCFSYYISYTLVFHLQDPDVDFELWCHVTGRWDKMFSRALVISFSGFCRFNASSHTIPHTHALLYLFNFGTCPGSGSLVTIFFAFLSSSPILVLGTWGMRQCNLVIGLLLGLEFLEFNADYFTC